MPPATLEAVRTPSQEIPSEQNLLASVARIASTLEALQPALQALAQSALQNQQQVEEKYHRFSGFDRAEKALESSPIAPLLADDSISDIMINGPHEVYISRAGTLEKTDIQFPDHEALVSLAEKVAESVGRDIDPKRPLADARLRDGSRVNIIAPPMAVSGLSMSIRKFPKQEITLDKLIELNTLTPEMADFLKMCAGARVSTLISGGTGTGKTTLLNAISQFIPASERIVTIEDTAELRLQQPHVVKLETKEPHILGDRSEEVNTADLVRNALRMRPDRIIVGEVRGQEAFDMIQAMNTGHEGSMTTIHANSPRDAFTRVENLLAPVMQNTPVASIRRQMASAIGLIVQITRFDDGARLVSSITEVVGLEGETVIMQDIFALREEREPATGALHYVQEWSGIVPRNSKIAEAMRSCGMFGLQKMVEIA